MCVSLCECLCLSLKVRLWMNCRRKKRRTSWQAGSDAGDMAHSLIHFRDNSDEGNACVCNSYRDKDDYQGEKLVFLFILSTRVQADGNQERRGWWQREEQKWQKKGRHGKDTMRDDSIFCTVADLMIGSGRLPLLTLKEHSYMCKCYCQGQDSWVPVQRHHEMQAEARKNWVQKTEGNELCFESVTHKTCSSSLFVFLSDAYFHIDSTSDLLFTSSFTWPFFAGCVVVSDHFLVHFSLFWCKNTGTPA